MAPKREPKTLTFHDYLVKYKVGFEFLLAIVLALWSKSVDKGNNELTHEIKEAKMEILISNNTDRIIAIEHVLYHN